jgi:hypothetical protein
MNIIQLQTKNAKTYAGKERPSRSDFDFDDGSLAAIWNVVSRDDIYSWKGAKPTREIFDRAISRSKKGVVGKGSGGECDVDVFSSALAAAEDLASRSIGQAAQKSPTNEVIDIFALAGDVAYYAEGVDVFRGHIWRWHDGGGDSIERIYSAAETEAATQQQQQQQQQRVVVVVANDSEVRTIPRASKMSHLIRTCREGMIGRVLRPRGHDDEDYEPFTIFGLRCATPLCGGGGSVVP